jgi:hypothetical protein
LEFKKYIGKNLILCWKLFLEQEKNINNRSIFRFLIYSIDVTPAAGVNSLNYEIDISCSNFPFPDLRSDDMGIAQDKYIKQTRLKLSNKYPEK